MSSEILTKNNFLRIHLQHFQLYFCSTNSIFHPKHYKKYTQLGLIFQFKIIDILIPSLQAMESVRNFKT